MDKKSVKNVNFRYKNIFIKKGVLTMEKNYITSKEKVIERVKLGEEYSNLEKVLNVKPLIGKIIKILSYFSTVENLGNQRIYKKYYSFFKEILLSGSPPPEKQDLKLNKYVCKNDIMVEVIING